MTKLMKMCAASLAALCIVAVVALQASAAASTQSKEPTYSSGVGFTGNPSFIGLKSTSTYGPNSGAVLSNLNASKAKQLLGQPGTAGKVSGLLYAICASGGTLGKYSLAYDTNMPGTIDMNSRSEDGKQQLITPPVFTKVFTTPTGAATDTMSYNLAPTCWVPVWPQQFRSGLLGVQSDTGHDTIYYYRLDSGSNP
jgi:hypothetical protein